MSENPPCRLYLITPPRIEDPAAFAETLARTLDAADTAAVQIRLKDTGEDDISRTAEAVIPVCRARGVTVIMNDNAELARRIGCDGAHLGEDDGDIAEARRILGPEAVIGASCYASADRAMQLTGRDGGADYAAFGAVYPTSTKTPKTLCPLEIIENWSLISVIPCAAIGGITPENAGSVIEAGADFLAVISAVWGHADGPAAGAAAFEAVLAHHRR
ncbi:MAG: thiamine phosphate synthase [Rhodospirillales bacterium]